MQIRRVILQANREEQALFDNCLYWSSFPNRKLKSWDLLSTAVCIKSYAFNQFSFLKSWL